MFKHCKHCDTDYFMFHNCSAKQTVELVPLKEELIKTPAEPEKIPHKPKTCGFEPSGRETQNNCHTSHAISNFKNPFIQNYIVSSGMSYVNLFEMEQRRRYFENMKNRELENTYKQYNRDRLGVKTSEQ